MNLKQMILMMFSIIFGFGCLLWSLLWMVMAKDLGKQVTELENEVIQLKWENENNYMYCEVE